MTPLSHGLLTATDEQVRLARDFSEHFTGTPELVLEGESRQELPPQLASMVARVLEAVAQGQRVTITTMPSELTSTAAAALLGVSRPTLMKLARAGALPSHMVGSHTRFRSDDVLTLAGRRADERRTAAERLRSLADDLDLID